MTDTTLAWPLAYPEILAKGVIRQTCEDFVVEEVLPIRLQGSGAHWYVFVEAVQWNTQDLAEHLASELNIPLHEIGYCGRKDKHAVTRQWFSVPATQCSLADVSSVLQNTAGAQILQMGAADKKIRIGCHTHNRFEIRVRWQTPPPRAVIIHRLRRLAVCGVPNYFGVQRFGYHGTNVEQARHWLLNRKNRGRRAGSGWHLSVFRGWFFNRLLGHLVANGIWNSPCLPELTKYWRGWGAPSHSAERCGASEAGQMALLLADGRYDLPGDVAWTTWERRVYHRLRHWRFRHQIRSVGVIPKDFHYEMDSGQLTLRFALPTGAYATSVLRELGDIRSAVSGC